MEAFCLFKNGIDSDKPDFLEGVLLESGFEKVGSVSSSDSVEADLREARLLVVLISHENDFSDRSLSDRWRYFQNELRWKRKIEGDILLVLDEGVDEKKVPLTLRDLPLIQIEKGEKAIKNKIEAILKVDTASPSNKMRAFAGEETLRVEALAAAQRQEKRRHEKNGCEKNHVYESGTKVRTPYLDRLAETLEKKKKESEEAKKKRTGIDDIVIDTSDMDKAIKSMEKEVALLDNEVKSACSEIDNAAAKLSKSDVTLSFSGYDKKIELNDKPKQDLIYSKGSPRSGNSGSSSNQSNNSSSSPFGGKYDKEHEQKRKELKKNNSGVYGGIVVVSFFVFILILILANLF